QHDRTQGPGRPGRVVRDLLASIAHQLERAGVGVVGRDAIAGKLHARGAAAGDERIEDRDRHEDEVAPLAAYYGLRLRGRRYSRCFMPSVRSKSSSEIRRGRPEPP